MEQTAPSPEEEEKVLDESVEMEEDKSESEGEDEEEECSDRTDENAESEERVPPPAPAPDEARKDAGVLNLNNEVVRMRKEVKRLRALIIRKVTRQIAALRKKKGKEAEVERNQRRAARLLEEVHAMKNLSPDLVTKTALQTNLNFEAVCKNPKSTIADRATARIATHPQFQKKISSIKAAVKAFKIERMKTGRQGVRERGQQQAEKQTPQMPEKGGSRTCEKRSDPAAVIQNKGRESTDGAEAFKSLEDPPVVEGDVEETKETSTAEVVDARKINIASDFNIVRPTVEENINATVTTKSQPQSKAVKKKPSLKCDPVEGHGPTHDDHSGSESSEDEEKEYFDDSTEERFLKLSSQSDESEEDDFFVGKVRKYKKKKKVNVEQSVKKSSPEDKKPSDKLQGELDELESRLKSKARPLQSAFCSSLRGNKTGGGRGRGADRFRGRGKPRGAFSVNREFSKQSDYQKQEKGIEMTSGFRHKETTSESGEKGLASARRGRGGGLRQRGPRGRGVFTQRAPQETLHPSWEASKKKKEQQGQILAFQGKKIKFDDD
ncbi:serum response factor-binding protein 1 [Gouania willdenowi]|uniref:Serum response factor-binding protein 1 n=1 Tax=Gouania willdenowi TaxID=441366 RepID=A0A8C5ER42_GOUWI|nr:serum response factor-binding protein 1 [Gouania willdenowi]